MGVGYLAGNNTRSTETATFTQTFTRTSTLTSWQTITSTTTFAQGRPISIATIETASIPIGGSATPVIGVNPNAGRIYVTDGSTLVVIDASSHSVIARVTLPASSNAGVDNAGIAVDYNSGTVFVSVQGGVAEVNGTTNTVIRELPLNFGSLAYNPSTRTIYGSPESGNGSLVGVAVQTGSVVENVSLGYRATNIALNQRTNMVYTVGCDQMGLACDSVVSLVNGTSGTLVTTVRLNSAYYSTMTYDQTTNVVYASGEEELVALNGTSGRVIFRADPETCGPFLDMGVIPPANLVLMVPQNYGYLLVYDGGSGTLLSMYSANSPQTVAYNPKTNELYLAAAGVFLAFHYSNLVGSVNSTLIGSGQTCLPV